MDKEIIYLVEFRRGGVTKTVFKTQKEAEECCKHNFYKNAVWNKLIPFSCDGYNYYYSIAGKDSVSIYNRHYGWIQRVRNVDTDNFTIQQVIDGIRESYNESIPF